MYVYFKSSFNFLFKIFLKFMIMAVYVCMYHTVRQISEATENKILPTHLEVTVSKIFHVNRENKAFNYFA